MLRQRLLISLTLLIISGLTRQLTLKCVKAGSRFAVSTQQSFGCLGLQSSAQAVGISDTFIYSVTCFVGIIYGTGRRKSFLTYIHHIVMIAITKFSV